MIGTPLSALTCPAAVPRSIPPIQGVCLVRLGSRYRYDPLVRGNDGNIYCLKLCTRNHRNLAANEMLTSCVLEGLGLSIPAFQPLILSDSTVRMLKHGGHTPQHYIYPEDKLCCSVRFLGNDDAELVQWPSSSALKRIVNEHECLGMFIFDVWAASQEQRQCIYRRNLLTGRYQAFFVDNQFLFGGPAWPTMARHARCPACACLNLRFVNHEAIENWISYFQQHIPSLLRASVYNLSPLWHNDNLSPLMEALHERLLVLGSLVDFQLREPAHAGSTQAVHMNCPNANTKGGLSSQ